MMTVAPLGIGGANLLGDPSRLAVEAAVRGKLEPDHLRAGAFEQVAGDEAVRVHAAFGIGVAKPEIAVRVVEPDQTEADPAAVIDGRDQVDRLSRVGRRTGLDRCLVPLQGNVGGGRRKREGSQRQCAKSGAQNHGIPSHCRLL
jgi:hypothetical protein